MNWTNPPSSEVGPSPAAPMPGGPFRSLSSPEPLESLDGYPLNRPDRPGSPSALLDPTETTVGFNHPLDWPGPSGTTAAEQDAEYRAHVALCQGFRHSGWQRRREATAAALRMSGAAASRLERFAGCGAVAWVLRRKDEHATLRVASNRCHDRFCVPCADEHRRIVCRNLRTALAGKTLRFMTLTLRSADRPLKETLSFLAASWRRLRAVLAESNRLSGGVSFLELTLNEDTRCWHPHLHVICEGAYIPHAWLSAKWLEITGDSFIVDVRALRGADAAAGYVSKYASKALSASVVRDSERFVEAVDALQGTRTFNTFGDWTGLRLSESPDDDGGWEPLAPLWLIMLKAHAGDRDALAILIKLRRSDCNDPSDLLDCMPEGP